MQRERKFAENNPQAIQDADKFVSSPEQFLRNLALHLALHTH